MSAASKNLKANQRQLDMDGCEVGVSRQAIEETLTEYADMVSALQDIASGNLGVTDAMLESREAMMSALANYCQERARVVLAQANGS